MANINNTYAQRHYESALDFFDQGQYEKAMQQIEKAIQKAPSNPDLYATKGIFLHRMNNLVHAIEAYHAALKVSPDHSFSHYNLGLIFMKQNKTLQAIQEWEAVIRVKPHDTDAIFNIAVALAHLGKSKQSIPFYRKVLEIDPDHVQTHQNLGVIYRDEGNFSLAKQHFKKLKELDSTYIEVVETEIIKCEEQEFLQKLTLDNQKLSDTVAHDSSNLLTDALIAIIEEDYDKALQLVEKPLKDDPDDAQALIIQGQALAALSKSSDAIAVFMRVIAGKSDATEALFHLGNIFLGLGELEKALEFYERLKGLEPDHPLLDENISSIRAKLSLNK
ncbi:MAG TPA: tetratricopeptide repeat protein [Candidatus Rifleibacterium sp.]|nr:tetratricopeptide repeat protein [Candidatus Rifleibacterium sp.]HPT44385.1 tetratricopeptide repeat protein [Candidatus Rifleibacterium sp.]